MPDQRFRIGDEIPPRQFTADDDSMRVFSLIMDDPNPIHFDPEFVSRNGLGDGPVNQGTLNLAYPLDAVLDWAGAAALVERFTCRFLGSVHSGDRVSAAGQVTAVDDGPPERATVSLWLELADGVRVLEGEATLAVGTDGETPGG